MKQERKIREHLAVVLRALRLPTLVVVYAEIADQVARQGGSFEAYLNHLTEAELSDRKRRRIKGHLKRSKLPEGKTLSTIDPSKVPLKVRRHRPTLCEGAFADHAENGLACGLPGRGRTDLLCAMAHELIQRGYRVLCRPAYARVQTLLLAKREVVLNQPLRRLDRYDVVDVDDIGDVQQDRQEVDHALILELSGASIRNQAASQRNTGNHETSQRKDGDE